MSNPLLPPIEHEQFTMAMIRIACRLVELDYRRHKELYTSYPPLRVSGLADLYRSSLGFPQFHGPLIYISKALAVGFKLREIPLHNPDKAWRAIHKKRVGLRRS